VACRPLWWPEHHPRRSAAAAPPRRCLCGTAQPHTSLGSPFYCTRTHTRPCAPVPVPSTARQHARRRALLRRAASTAVRSSPHPAAPCNPLQWITHATGVLPDQTPARFTPGTPSSKNSSRAPPRRKVVGEPRRCPAHPVDSSHPIQRPRSRLDRVTVWSVPPDPDPTDQICRYPFGLTILLKSP